MIPSSSGGESEGQIATALSLSLLFPLSLLSVFITIFHSHLGTLAFNSPFVPPLSPLSLPFPSSSSPSFHFSQFCSVIFALSPLFSNFILLARILVGRRHTHTHTESHALKLTHLSYHPSVPQVITSQTHPRKHHINLGFKLTPRNAQRHKNIYRLHYTSRPVEFDMLLRTRWV